MAVTATSPPPSRWTLRTIRVTIKGFGDLTLSGVWRAPATMPESGLPFGGGATIQSLILITLLSATTCSNRMKEAATAPDRVARTRCSSTRWAMPAGPDPACDWTGRAPDAPPLADRAKSPNRLWRIIGAMNALTGRVDFLDDYIVGRAKVIKFYEQLNRSYPEAERLLVVQDNWSIHRHDDVTAALTQWPRIEPVWLPTYAPWLNPIEKLWRWLRQDVLKLHRLAGDWPAALPEPGQSSSWANSPWDRSRLAPLCGAAGPGKAGPSPERSRRDYRF